MTEKFSWFPSESTVVSEHNVGLGLFGGLDIRLSTFLSLPIEVFLLAKPEDDISGMGFSFGLNWNFGTAKAGDEDQGRSQD